MEIKNVNGRTILIRVLPEEIPKNGIFITPPDVTVVGAKAFSLCHNLKQISMPKVTEVGEDAFADCVNLERVEMPEVIKILTSAFLRCKRLKQISMPNVIEVGMCAFACTQLERVVMLKVIKIGRAAFSACPNLREIKLSGNLLSEMPDAFNIFPNLPLIIIAADNTKEFNRVIDLFPEAMRSQSIPSMQQDKLNDFALSCCHPQLLRLKGVNSDVHAKILSFSATDILENLPIYQAFRKTLLRVPFPDKPEQFKGYQKRLVEVLNYYISIRWKNFALKSLENYLEKSHNKAPEEKRHAFFSGKKPSGKNVTLWQTYHTINKLIQYLKTEETPSFNQSDRELIEQNEILLKLFPADFLAKIGVHQSASPKAVCF